MLNFRKLKRPYLIAEIGVNHLGDLQITKRLIDAAYAAGWNCVKFQKRTPELCVPEDQKHKKRETPWGIMEYIEYRNIVEFSKREYDYIRNYCREKPIAWTASVWDIESLEFLCTYKNEIEFIKIPSAHLTNDDLVVFAARSGISVILSTGMSTLEEIDHAVDLLKSNRAEFALMHCNSSYPAANNELNLSCIRSLTDRYSCVVGYSGHEVGLSPTEMSIAFGAIIIERHVTLDKNSWGTDQKNSIIPEEMCALKKNVDEAFDCLGDGKKRVCDSEIPHRDKMRAKK
jgi:N-acetylneuraminate synthase